MERLCPDHFVLRIFDSQSKNLRKGKKFFYENVQLRYSNAHERETKSPSRHCPFHHKKMNTVKSGFSLTILLLIVMGAEAFSRQPVIKPATPVKDSTTEIKAREVSIVDGSVVSHAELEIKAREVAIVDRKVVSNAELNGSLQTKPESGGSATIPNEVLNLVKSIVGAAALSLPAGTQLSPFHLLLLDKAKNCCSHFFPCYRNCRLWERTFGGHSSSGLGDCHWCH